MKNDRNIRYKLRKLQHLPIWQLCIVLILLGFVAATFLRINNNEMVERRTAVALADKTGDETSIRNNLYSLQRHAAAHMNAGSGLIYLEHSYNRDTQKALQLAQVGPGAGNDVLAKADATCKQHYSGYSQAYVHCVAAEQAKYPAAANATQFVAPNSELYRHEFYSPAWSPDFAGWTVVIFIIIASIILYRITEVAILKLMLKKYYSSI